MKNILITTLLVLMASTSLHAQEAKPTPMDPKMQEMMKKYQEFSTPGASHKRLADMAGEWNVSTKFWETANGKPQESKGTASMKMIFGGRWLQQDFKGEAMGKPFEGMGLMGYDNLKGKYETLWIDSMSTGVMRGTGDFDAKKKAIAETGTFSCPMSDDKVREFRGDWKIVDKNNMVYTTYGPGPNDAKEFKQMEIVYKRK